MPTKSHPASAPAAVDSVDSFHYFATCALAWATGSTPADAIKKLARSLDPAMIRRCLSDGGVYVWTCRVELPPNASYSINFYKPEKQDDGTPVPLSDACDWALLTAKGTAVPTMRDASIVNRGK